MLKAHGRYQNAPEAWVLEVWVNVGFGSTTRPAHPGEQLEVA
jgi:hypothetical protein